MDEGLELWGDIEVKESIKNQAENHFAKIQSVISEWNFKAIGKKASHLLFHRTITLIRPQISRKLRLCVYKIE